MTDAKNDQCLNCQSKLDGPFCSQCGQAKRARLVPIREWMGDLLETFFSLDSKLLGTLKRILFQPGQATLDFANGQRVPFDSPARVYVIISAVAIALMTVRGVFSVDHYAQLPRQDVDQETLKRIQFLFPFVNLLSPFFTAAVLAIVQPRSFFQLHLAFSFHLWTFFSILSTSILFVPIDSIWMIISFALVVVISTGYAFTAHYRVYPMSITYRLFSMSVLLTSLPVLCFLFLVLLYLLATMIG